MTDAKRMTQEQVFEWLRSARHMMGDELLDMMEAHLLALESAPEDIKGDALDVLADLSAEPHAGRWCADNSGCVCVKLSRLAAAAARVPGLEAELAEERNALEAKKGEALVLESERDALRARVAELEADTDRRAAIARAEKAESRATAAVAALWKAEREIQKRLEGGPWSPQGEAHLNALLSIIQPAALAVSTTAPPTPAPGLREAVGNEVKRFEEGGDLRWFAAILKTAAKCRAAQVGVEDDLVQRLGELRTALLSHRGALRAAYDAATGGAR